MPKLKSHKGTQKRVRSTGAHRLMRRTTGQDHFNSRESGKTVRNKRRDAAIHPSDEKALRRLLPYS